MMPRRAVAAATVFVVTILALTACNPAASKPETGVDGSTGVFTKDLSGTLKTSGYNPSDEVGISRSDLAAQKVAPVKVSMDTTNFDPQKFAAQAASGNVPDLVQVDRSVVGTLADKGLIRPLTDCFSTWGADPGSLYYEAALKDVTYDKQIYAVPQFFQASILIGDKRVMAKAGVTDADLDTSKPDAIIAAAKKMYVASGGKPSVLGFDGDLPGSAALWLAVFGGAPNDETGKPTLDASNNAKALTWMKQLMDAQGGYAAVKSFKDTMDVFGDGNEYVKDQVGVQTWAQWYVNVLANTSSKVSIVGVSDQGS